MPEEEQQKTPFQKPGTSDLPEPGQVGAMQSTISKTEFKEGERYTFLTPPEGWRPTEEYLSSRLAGLAKRSLTDKNFELATGDMGDLTNIMPEGGMNYNPTTDPQDLGDWDWKNPPVDEGGNPVGPDGDPLPPGAEGWTPHGTPFYGEGLKGVWNHIKSIWKGPADPEDLSFDEDKGFLQKITDFQKIRDRATYTPDISQVPEDQRTPAVRAMFLSGQVPGTAGKAITSAMVGFGGLLDVGAKGTERILGASSLTLEEFAEESTLPAAPVGDSKFADLVERVNPIRMGWNLIRATEAGYRSGDLNQVDDIISAYRDNLEVARMAYSIGAQDAQKKHEFMNRVGDGEDPRLVAMEMENPWMEMLGRVVFDPWDIVAKFAGAAKMGARLAASSDEFAEGAFEVGRVLSRHGDEGVEALRAGDNVDELVDATRKAGRRVLKGIEKEAGQLGILKSTGSAKQFNATKRSATVGSWIAGELNDVDDVTLAFENLARLTSSDSDEVRKGIAFLSDALDNPEPAFSKAGLELSHYLRGFLEDASGKINPEKFLDELDEVRKTEDVAKVWRFIQKKTDDVIEKTFPTYQDMVDSGQGSFMHKLLARAEQNAWKKFNQNVSGRLYIGLNPRVAIRGATFDILQSSMDMGPGTAFHRPSTWADITTKWLGGVEHPGLSRGFAKSKMDNLTKMVAEETEYEDLPSFVEAAVGPEGTKLLDRLSMSGARLLEFFEIKSSQRVIGKATSDAMRRLLRSDVQLNRIDDLVDAGLSPNVADSLVNRILKRYGDVDVVKKNLFAELADGEIDLFKTLRWIGDREEELLTQYNLFDEFVDTVEEADNSSVVISKLEEMRNELFEATKSLETQHASPIDDLHDQTFSIAKMNEDILEAVENGDYLGDNFHLSDNRIVANGHVKDSVRAGLFSIREQVGKWIKANHGDEAYDQFHRWARRFDTVTDDFKSVTAENERLRTVAARGAEKIKQSDEWKDTARKAFADLDIAAPVPDKKSDAISVLWESFFGWQKKAFQSGREASVNKFYNLLDEARQFADDDWYNATLKRSADIKAAHINIKEARKLDNAIMVNGKMKPIGDYVRALIQIDDTENAVRGLASYYEYAPSLQPNSKVWDSAILDTLKQYNPAIEADIIADVDLNEAVKGFEFWRNSRGFPRKAANLEEIVGPKPSVRLPEIYKDVNNLINDFKQGTPLVGDDAGKLVKFLNQNAEADELQELQEILTNARSGEDVLQGILDRSNRIVGMAEDVLARTVDDVGEEALERPDDYARTIEQFLDDAIESIIPPHDGGNISAQRNIHESRHIIDATFNNLIDDVKNNWGRTEYQGLTDEIEDALNSYFDTAKRNVSQHRIASAGYADEMRKFVLHDYPNRLGADILLSNFFNFHFWPSRTAYKWLTSRIWTNPNMVNKYLQFRNAMEKKHAAYPDWWKYAINTNELLGLDSENPIFMRIENFINPIYDLTSTDFTDDKKRVNWWSTALDDLGKNMPGYLNPAIIYATAIGLRARGENEAAARWAGRSIPATKMVQSLTAMMGVREGRGIELDPGIQIFSGGIGPYEKNRIARALAQMVKDGDFTEEQIIDAARSQSGPAWDEAVARQRSKEATGTLISNFIGINSRRRSMDDLIVDQFWGDYSKLWAMSGSMDSNEFRYNMEKMRDAYPFMDALLLGRKGGSERDSAYAYAVLSRVKPGQTDDLSKAMGMPYDMIQKFYETKGDFSEWTEGDRSKFMGAIADMGTTLALPNDATRKEWLAASTRYSTMRDEAEQLFGEDIWAKIDVAYNQKGVGVNSSVQFEQYLEDNPVVERAMDWRTRYILQDPILSAYYGGIDKLRSYYSGLMYTEIEKELGEDIWDNWTQYWSYVNTGQEDRADEFWGAHPELSEYGDLKEAGLKEIQERMLKFGNDLPGGKDMRLREDREIEGIGQRQVEEFIEQPQTRGFTIQEWTQLLGPEQTRLAILAYEGDTLPQDIRNILEQQASSFDLTYRELIEEVGTAARE